MRSLAIVILFAGCVDSFTETDARAVAQLVPSLCNAPPAVRGVSHCTNGGSLDIGGTVSGTLDGAQSGTLLLAGAATFDDCASGDGDDRPTLLDSALDVSSSCTISAGEPRSERTTLAGTFGWTLGGTSGSCEIDLVVESAYGGCLLGGERTCVYETVSRGTVCGYPANRRCTHDVISSCRDL